MAAALHSMASTTQIHLHNALGRGPTAADSPMRHRDLTEVIDDLAQARIAAAMTLEGIEQTMALFRMEKADLERGD
jgi:hypothetical protein